MRYWCGWSCAKGVHFRASKLHYVEIGDIARAAEPLLALGWIDEQSPLPLDVVFEVLLKAEILQCFGAAIDQPKAKKSDWLPELSEQFPEIQPFNQWCAPLDDRLFSLTIMGLCDRLRLMFFGNLYQDWSEFVLADLGIFTYEKSSSVPNHAACAVARTWIPACFFMIVSSVSMPEKQWRRLSSRSTDWR